MDKNKSVKNQKELELGKYLESDLLALTEDEVCGGGTPAVISLAVTAFISEKTCPSSVCTRAC